MLAGHALTAPTVVRCEAVVVQRPRNKRKRPSSSAAQQQPTANQQLVTDQDLLPLPNDIVLTIFQYLSPWDWTRLSSSNEEGKEHSAQQARALLLHSASFEVQGWKAVAIAQGLAAPVANAKKIKTWRDVLQREMKLHTCSFCNDGFGTNTHQRTQWPWLCAPCKANPATACLTQTEACQKYHISPDQLHSQDIDFQERPRGWKRVTYIFKETDVIALKNRLATDGPKQRKKRQKKCVPASSDTSLL